MTEPVTVWFATRRDNLVIIAEDTPTHAVYGFGPKSKEFRIRNAEDKMIQMGTLLGVDASPEVLLMDLDIEEGQRILLLPAASRRRAVECSAES